MLPRYRLLRSIFNNATILVAIGYSTAGTASTYQFLYNTAVGNLIIVLAGAVPGYWFSVATLDIVGRRPIQMMGFIILTAIFAAMGFAYFQLTSGGLLALYVVAQFFFNFGPNTTTFIVPGEVFLTRYRSTSHGISAASGKIGSIIGQVRFQECWLLIRILTHNYRVLSLHSDQGRHSLQPQSLAGPCSPDLPLLHAVRLLHYSAHSRDQAQNPRGAL